MNTREQLTDKQPEFNNNYTKRQEAIDFSTFKREVERLSPMVRVVDMPAGSRYDAETWSEKNEKSLVEIKSRAARMHQYPDWFINKGKYDWLKANTDRGFIVFLMTDGWAWYQIEDGVEWPERWCKVKNENQGECMELNYLIPEHKLHYYSYINSVPF